MTLKSNRAEVEGELRASVRKKLSATGITVQNRARQRCPVDTGRLRNSITHDASDTGVVIGTNVKYAPFVELGTSRQRPQPYLIPGLMDSRGDLQRIWRES